MVSLALSVSCLHGLQQHGRGGVLGRTVLCRAGRRAESAGGRQHTHRNSDDEGPRWRQCAQCVCAACLACLSCLLPRRSAVAVVLKCHLPLPGPLVSLALSVSWLHGLQQHGRGVLGRTVLRARAAVSTRTKTATTKAHVGISAHSACVLPALPASVVCCPGARRRLLSSNATSRLPAPWCHSLSPSAACMDCSSMGEEC